MDVITAAQNMCHLIAGSDLPAEDPEYGKDHMYDMIMKIQSGEVSGEKAHRWLGYIQGCVVSNGDTTLEDVKNVNFSAVTKWETKKPPHNELVEVEGVDGIIQVKAVHGGDGVFPHWTNESESMVWEHGSFDCWRPLTNHP